MDISLKVSSLITIHGDWNSPLLNELFPPCDVNYIRSFPPVTSMEDRHIWAYTKDGQYSVKSGNWLLTHAASRLETTTEALQALNKIKDRIWLLKTAPKIQMFLWRSLSGALAVADCMRSHGLMINPSCQICQLQEETISHVLFGCTLATSVWQNAALSLPVHGFT